MLPMNFDNHKGYELTANPIARESERSGRVLSGAEWRIESPHLGGKPVLSALFHNDEHIISTVMRPAFGERPERYIMSLAERMAHAVMSVGGFRRVAYDQFHVGERLALCEIYTLGGVPEAMRALNERHFWGMMADALVVCDLTHDAARMDALATNAVARIASPLVGRSDAAYGGNERRRVRG